MREEAALFGANRSLVGIVTLPALTSESDARPGVILLNAGIVHRTGPGRIYVKIARELAAIGFVVLRFDLSGIGDSPVRPDTLCFEKSAIVETREAMDYLNLTRGIDRFILMGGCSGAFISFETACCEPRVLGTVLINFQTPDPEDEVEQAERMTRNAAHYYWNRALFDLKSWRKLLTGKTDYAQLVRATRLEVRRWFGFGREKVHRKTQFALNLQRLAERNVQVVFICSQGDPRLRDLREAGGFELKRLCSTGDVALVIVSRADHTFSSFQDQERLLQVIRERINAISPALTAPVAVEQPALFSRRSPQQSQMLANRKEFFTT